MNVKENFIKKKTESGIDTETATKDVTEYLNGDFKLSFDAKFEQQGTDGTHEQYIRLSLIHILNNCRIYTIVRIVKPNFMQKGT